MLEIVGHPVVVNPDCQLRRIAHERSWPVLKFEQPVALGDRIPLDRRWGAITGLTLIVLLGMWTAIRRTRKHIEI